MKQDILARLRKLPIPQDVSIEGLKLLLENLNLHPERVNDIELTDAYKYLRLLGVKDPEKINTKYLGILVASWIEERGKNQIHIEKEEVASTTGGDLKKQIEDYEKKTAQNEKIRTDTKKDTAKVLDKKQKIAEEQRRIQEEIRKAKDAELKTKGKKIYASVETKNKYQVDENTQNAHEALKSETIDSLSKKIEEQLADSNIQTEDKREREVLARSIAVGIIAQVNNPNLEHSIKAKVLETVGNSNLFENLAENDLIETAKKGSISLAINERSLVTLGRQTIKHLYGDAVSEMVYGPEVIIVSLSPNQQQSSNYEIDVQAISTNYERLLTKQSQALEDVTKSKTPETTLITRVINYTREKEEVVKKDKKKSSETEKTKELIEKFGLKKTPKSLFLVEIEANPWVEKVLNNNTALNTLAEETTRPNIASSIVTVISKSLFTKTAGSIAAKEAVAIAIGGLNPLQTALVLLGKEVLSKIQQWIKKNPEAAALIFGGLAFFGALPLFGPLIALGVASVIVAGTIGVGVTTAAVFGTLNLIRFVWSRIIISLAGPMIVVFVVIPILTAFTLFIINSGAYVVPPSTLDSPGGIGIPISGTPIDIDCESIDESLPPTAFAAELIVCTLNELKLNPLFSTMVGNSNWQQLTTVLNSVAIAELQRSANIEGYWNGVPSKHLQCVGFVEATAGQAYGSVFDHKNACNYIGTGAGGYRYIAGSQGIKSGDFFLINGRPCSANSPGHIGVVISVDGVSITCADANATGPGQTRIAKGCYVLSQITGYLRKN